MEALHVPGHSRRRTIRQMVIGTVVVVGVVLLATGIVYRRQIVALLTHVKGGPSTRWVYVPHSP